MRQDQGDFRPATSQEQGLPEERAGRLHRVRAALSWRPNGGSLLPLIGVALIIYGAVGLTATLYGYSLVREAFGSARELGVLAPTEKGRALRGLQSISATLDDAAAASSNMSASFRESGASLTTASEVATEVAAAFREVARASSFQVLGVQPLREVAVPFQSSSERLDDLSEDLARTSTAVAGNAADMQRLSASFSRLRVEIENLSQTVSRLPSDPTSGEGAQRLETALSAMLFWIGLQGLACLFAGLAIILLPLSRRRRATL